eukprot:Gb_06415 [translate_table: standard]
MALRSGVLLSEGCFGYWLLVDFKRTVVARSYMKESNLVRARTSHNLRVSMGMSTPKLDRCLPLGIPRELFYWFMVMYESSGKDGLGCRILQTSVTEKLEPHVLRERLEKAMVEFETLLFLYLIEARALLHCKKQHPPIATTHATRGEGVESSSVVIAATCSRLYGDATRGLAATTHGCLAGSSSGVVTMELLVVPLLLGQDPVTCGECDHLGN